mmetsp:Transcript_12849/g.32026  ORF Transcript_12849/g.32026 Transcript_12849/m.32026 type:complete len:419 (+) Transcript_12849:233-1489(+)
MAHRVVEHAHAVGATHAVDAAHAALALLADLLLEVHVGLEVGVEREEHVQRLGERRVHGDVEQCAHDAHQLRQLGLQVGVRQLDRLEELLELRGPDLHEGLDVGHRLRVVHRRRRLVPVQVVDRGDPARDRLGVLLGGVDARHRHDVRAARLAHRAQLQLQHVGVGLQGGGLVELVQAEVVRLAVGPRHLDEGVDVADRGDVVGDEGAHLRLELDVVRLVAGDVLEELLDLAAHLEVGVLGGVVHALAYRAALAHLVAALALLLVIVAPAAAAAPVASPLRVGPALRRHAAEVAARAAAAHLARRHHAHALGAPHLTRVSILLARVVLSEPSAGRHCGQLDLRSALRSPLGGSGGGGGSAAPLVAAPGAPYGARDRRLPLRVVVHRVLTTQLHRLVKRLVRHRHHLSLLLLRSAGGRR